MKNKNKCITEWKIKINVQQIAEKIVKVSNNLTQNNQKMLRYNMYGYIKYICLISFGTINRLEKDW